MISCICDFLSLIDNSALPDWGGRLILDFKFIGSSRLLIVGEVNTCMILRSDKAGAASSHQDSEFEQRHKQQGRVILTIVIPSANYQKLDVFVTTKRKINSEEMKHVSLSKL